MLKETSYDLFHRNAALQLSAPRLDGDHLCCAHMITRLSLVIAGLVTCCQLVNAASAKRAVWFPLKDSNQWEFVSTNATNIISVQGKGTRTQLENLFGPSAKVFQRGQNVYVRNGGRASPLILAKRGLNSPWTVRFSADACDIHEAQWISTNFTVITPVGLIPHCRILYLRPQSGTCGPTSYDMLIYFAPGIGPVQIDLQDGTAPLVLASASVNGMSLNQEFIAPPVSDALTLMIPSTNFTNHSGTCATCDVAVNMQFQLTFSNSLAQPLCIGRQVELEFVNPVGSVMKLWSEDSDFDGQYFPDVLAPGQTHTWYASAKLIDRRGWLLWDDFRVWASVRGFLLPPNATECTLPSPNSNPVIFGAAQNISVTVRFGSGGGVIHMRQSF